MSRDKQIEEMRKDIYECNSTECFFGDQCEKCPRTELTKELYAKGYRKASEVAREIFEEIERILDSIDAEIESELEFEEKWGAENAIGDAHNKIAELKKKYTEDGK